SANAGTYIGSAYGVYGSAYGSDGTRIGVYGSASGGTINWAGYFDGRGRFTDQLVLDESLYASEYLQTLTNVYVGDTVFTRDLYAPFPFQPVRIGAGQDILMKIDGANGGYASAFKVINGLGADCFGSDEFGNAHTYGNHFIDDQLGVGTTAPTQKLEVDNGNFLVQGTNSFQGTGDAGVVYLGSIHHYIRGEYGFGVKIGTYAVGDALVIKEISGSVGIGTTTPAAGYKLSVDGKIIAEELKVQDSGGWPDFVFADDYELMPLGDVARSIEANGHLPGVPSASEIAEKGIMVGDMQKLLMQKIEELTLYVLQLKSENAQLAARVHQLEITR
ncbi:MAG: hypothetical protein R3330_04015, partial [Saprospiraceae bacterium]|nr:hypothetical protein [Saprospiraceae bacterium]